MGMARKNYRVTMKSCFLKGNTGKESNFTLKKVIVRTKRGGGISSHEESRRERISSDNRVLVLLPSVSPMPSEDARIGIKRKEET